MRAGDYVRYVGPGPVPTDPVEFMSEVDYWINNFRHGDHNCSTWRFRSIYPEKVPSATLKMPLDRKPYHYGLTCDWEVVGIRFKQHLKEVEYGLRVAEKFLG